MTIEYCVSLCQSKNYLYAGLQYGSECYCGDTYGKYGKFDELNCNFSCNGSSKERCGGFWANSIYDLSVITCYTNRCIACEGKSLLLKCPTNKNLNIINASYGRTDQITCPALPIYTKNTNCVSNQTQFLIKQCNNKNSCLVPNSSLIFGDPCIDTFKYLDIQKVCV